MSEDRRSNKDRIEDHLLEHIDEVVAQCKREVDDQVDVHAQKLEEVHICIQELKDEQKLQREQIDEIASGVNGVLGFLSDGAGTFRMAKRIGDTIKWIGGLGFSVGALTLILAKMSEKASHAIDRFIGWLLG